jgi:eukaryotic-like serine/threonine-protein kinase
MGELWASIVGTDEQQGAVLGGRYELEEVIGRGGHSAIWRAWDRLERCHVAIKMLNAEVAGDHEHTVRMVREQRAIAALGGTAVVRLLGMVNSADGALGLVLEHLEGRDLDDELADREARGLVYTGPELLALIEPLVRTLSVAHAAGIVHRDLKPGNVFVMAPERGGGVRLLDFGLARLPSSRPLTREGMVLGSPSYISPEVWQGHRDFQDHRVDVYALGVMVFRLLTGRVPFDAPRLRDKVELVCRAPRPSLVASRPDLPPAVDPVVARALAATPAERYDAVGELHRDLAEALRQPENAARAS